MNHRKSPSAAPCPKIATKHSRPLPRPGKPPTSGYAEPSPQETSSRDKPNPVVAGDETSQVAPPQPDKNVEYPSAPDGEPTPDDASDAGAGENIEYPSEEAPFDSLSQAGPEKPGTDDENPDDIDPLPPGEEKHEPIRDPDPADTKLHV